MERGDPRGVLAAAEQFEAWWKREGQYQRAGGSDYEKTFAYAGWMEARGVWSDHAPLPPLPPVNGYDKRQEGHYSAAAMKTYAWMAVQTAEVDARRYRWIRRNVPFLGDTRLSIFRIIAHDMPSLDTAIDEAIEKGTNGEING